MTREQAVDLLGTLACIHLILITIGLLGFRLMNFLPPGTSRDQDRTLFLAANVVSLTGMPASFLTPRSLAPDGQVFVLLLAVAAAATTIVGGGRFLAAAYGSRFGFLSHVVGVLPILLLAIFTGLFFGPFDAVSAATHLGFFRSTPVLASPGVLLATIPLIAVASILPLCPRAIRWRILGWSAGVWLVGGVLMWLGGANLASSAVAGINLRSAGLPLESMERWPTASRWVSLAMMAVGGAPATVAGGLSVLPVMLLAGGALALVRGRTVGRKLGVAIIWIACFVAAVAATHMGLLLTQSNLPADRSLFIAVAAVANVATIHDPLLFDQSAGYYILTAAMIVGKLLPLSMLCWFAAIGLEDSDTY